MRFSWLALLGLGGAAGVGSAEAASPASASARGHGGTLVYRDAQGRVLTEKDLEGFSGPARWEVIGDREVPEEARRLHEAGRQAGAAGDYARAHALFRKARQLAPAWPYPAYDDGYTYLLEGKPDEAEAAYREVNRLAPRGFFTVRTALDALSRERAGTLPRGTYLTYLSLEWTEDVSRKRAILDRLARTAPGFAPVWQQLAGMEQDDAKVLPLLEKGLAAHPDGETLGILTANKALLLDRRGKREAALQLLGALAVDPESTLGTECIAKATLANLLAHPPPACGAGR